MVPCTNILYYICPVRQTVPTLYMLKYYYDTSLNIIHFSA